MTFDLIFYCHSYVFAFAVFCAFKFQSKDLHFDPKCVTSGAEACLTLLAVDTHAAPLIWSSGPNSRLLAVRAHTIIYYNSPNWLTPVLQRPTETPCYISRLRWKSFSMTAMERTPHSLFLIYFSKLWKISVFYTTCSVKCRKGVNV